MLAYQNEAKAEGEKQSKSNRNISPERFDHCVREVEDAVMEVSRQCHASKQFKITQKKDER